MTNSIQTNVAGFCTLPTMSRQYLVLGPYI